MLITIHVSMSFFLMLAVIVFVYRHTNTSYRFSNLNQFRYCSRFTLLKQLSSTCVFHQIRSTLTISTCDFSSINFAAFFVNSINFEIIGKLFLICFCRSSIDKAVDSIFCAIFFFIRNYWKFILHISLHVLVGNDNFLYYKVKIIRCIIVWKCTSSSIFDLHNKNQRIINHRGE